MGVKYIYMNIPVFTYAYVVYIHGYTVGLYIHAHIYIHICINAYTLYINEYTVCIYAHPVHIK